MDLSNLSESDLLELRQKKQQQVSEFNTKQLAYKTLGNSAYGALGTQYFRYFDLRLAESITLTGQHIIQHLQKGINEAFNKMLGTEGKNYVIYGDTDSMYIDCASLLAKHVGGLGAIRKHDRDSMIRYMAHLDQDIVQPIITALCEQYAAQVNSPKPEVLAMKRECLMSRGLWTGKKHYTALVGDEEGAVYSPPKLKIVGIECVKSSTPPACRTKIKEAIQLILDDDQQGLIQFVADFRDQFPNLPISDIAFPRGVNGLSKYNLSSKHLPIHVRGSLVYNQALQEHGLGQKYEEIREGDKIRFVYLNPENILNQKVISYPAMATIPEEFLISGKIDFNTQFEKGFLKVVSELASIANMGVKKIRKLKFH